MTYFTVAKDLCKRWENKLNNTQPHVKKQKQVHSSQAIQLLHLKCSRFIIQLYHVCW